jgi:hypothetical protein
MGLGDWEDIGKTLPDASYGTVTTAAALLRSMRSPSDGIPGYPVARIPRNSFSRQ